MNIFRFTLIKAPRELMGMAAFMRASFQLVRLLFLYLLKNCDSINKNCKLKHYKKSKGQTKAEYNGRNNKQLINIKTTALELVASATTKVLIKLSILDDNRAPVCLRNC